MNHLPQHIDTYEITVYPSVDNALQGTLELTWAHV